jgi:chromosomal replication initiator protein
MTSGMNAFWQLCLSRFEQELSPQQYNTWIKPLNFTEDGNAISLIAPNRFVAQWVKERFLAKIQEWASTFHGHPKPVCLAVRGKGKSPAKKSSAEESVALKKAEPAEQPITSEDTERRKLSRDFTFDTFVSGRANQLARAAALQVAERPGEAYNPLFVYGGVGLGKTHLIQAIGNHVLSRTPKARVRYIHAERFVSDVVRAYQHKAFDLFKQDYHSLDLLLIDDIQFFAGKNRTQEEFFYAFNALIENHKQVIITCDAFPKELEGIEERLISRFGWGLTVQIEPPELEMRVAILLRKAEAEKIRLDENSAFYIAKLIRSNVRELEGALKRVTAYASFSGKPITLELSKEALRDIIAAHSQQVSIENIQKTVANYYKIKTTDMFSKKRSRIVARPRQMAMLLAKELTSMSLPDIGDAFGGRDHTTVLHACRKINELRKEDLQIAEEYSALFGMLTG